MADDAGEIYYDPDDWENLSDALKRVGEDVLYPALREGKLPWLFLAADFDPYHPTGAIDRRTVHPVEVEAPPAIGPGNFHSGSSQPVKLWRRKKGTWPKHDFAFWVVVFKADVTSLLRPSPRDMPPLRRRKKRASEVERTKRALAAIYPNPDGVPDQATVRDVRLNQQVNEWLVENGLDTVKIDTVLRAAGRRTDCK
jgi:hypothetical protein